MAASDVILPCLWSGVADTSEGLPIRGKRSETSRLRTTQRTTLFQETLKTMSEAICIARSSVVRVDGLHRRGTLEDGTTLEFGVHGPIKSHYGLESQANLPLPVDYLVTAGAG